MKYLILIDTDFSTHLGESLPGCLLNSLNTYVLNIIITYRYNSMYSNASL